jgi:flagellar biosynthesis protein FlhF
MQVKKFEAPTMQEALKVIKRELGPEAIILSTKNIKSGFGLMSKASVEVTAAISEKDLKKKNMAEKNLPMEVKEKIWNGKAEKQSAIYNDYFEKQLKKIGTEKVQLSGRGRSNGGGSGSGDRRNQKRNEQPNEGPVARSPANANEASVAAQGSIGRERRYADITDEEKPSGSSRLSLSGLMGRREESVAAPSSGQSVTVTSGGDKVNSLQREVNELKSMIEGMAINSAKENRSESEGTLTSELLRTHQDLVASGVEKRIASEIIREISFDLNPDEANRRDIVNEKVATHLMKTIRVGDALQGVGAASGRSTPAVLTLVGPTGVGKTTTIAKIASLGILEKRLRVGLINLDSYKVAAADQLSTYAKIMNVPFRTVANREELQQAVHDFAALDLILIDTTGRSQKDQESLVQLRHLLSAVPGTESLLVVSATTKDVDLHEVLARFKIFNPRGMVFSKLDETSVYGCILNAQVRSQLPVFYFTVGQRVPEDIERASAERVVDLILDL